MRTIVLRAILSSTTDRDSMMRSLIRFVVALVALAGSTTAFAGLPGSISGTWYNPAQSGHGLSLDVLAGDRAIAIWHVFDPNGQPLTLYIEAQIDGRRLSGPAYVPRGMRFGSFNPADLQLPVWGEVEISFSSCDQAELSWRSTQAGFPDGRMPLVRLTRAVGTECVLLPESALPRGLYIGEADATASRSGTELLGLVDGEGRLWGFERSFRSNGARIPIPGSQWIGNNSYPRVFRIEPDAVGDSEVRATSTMYPGLALVSSAFVDVTNASGVWRFGGPGGVAGEFGPATIAYGAHRWRPGAPLASSLIAPVDVDQLQGQYTVILRDQFFEYPATVTVGSDGSLCIPAQAESASEPCRLRGTLSTPEGRFGLIDFQVSDVRFPGLASYRGRGWLLDTPSGRELILVGDNGAIGLLVTAVAR